MGIPYITHQIWFQGWDQIPEKFKVNVKLLEELNPDFTHMKWDEDSLREECSKISPEVQAKFDSFPHMIQKIDLGRYVVLYNYGGVSVDTDMKSFKSIKYVPGFDKSDFIVSYSGFPGNMLGIINNALIMCVKNSPILFELIASITDANLREVDYSKKELYLDATTGVSKFKSILNKHKRDLLILNNSYFEPCLALDPFCRIPQDSIMDHKHENSWMSDGTKLFLQGCITLLYILVYLLVPALVIMLIIHRVLPGKISKQIRQFIRGIEELRR